MNKFGGEWTIQKIDIVVDYAKAYLTIMNRYPQFKTIYFDGFAGSGDIYGNDKVNFETIKGAAIRILEINEPKSFDMYYFVELDENNKKELEKTVHEKFFKKTSYVVCEDCNKKINDMAHFLKNHTNYKALAFIDPYGMSLKWSSIEILKMLGIDLWILVPTGIGINRLLKNDGNIKESWLKKLEITLGMSTSEIKEYFYKHRIVQTLFGTETLLEKEKHTIEKIGNLYRERLKGVFEFASEPLMLRNSTGSTMYHFMMATNNKSAFKIANDIIKKRN